MKIKFIALAASYLFIFYLVYRLFTPADAGLDQNFRKFIEKNSECNSFSADSLLYDNKGNLTGQTYYKQSRHDWEMIILTGINPPSSWSKIGDKVYVKDNQDKKWWETIQAKPQILSVLDYRPLLQTLKEPKNTDVNVKFLKHELCGTKTCLEYEIFDRSISLPGRNLFNHYVWFDQNDYVLQKEEYYSGNGDFSITSYSGCNQIDLAAPALTKKLPPDEDLFMLPAKDLVKKSQEKASVF